MTYCTLQDMIDRGWQEELVQLTDRTNTPATTVDAVVVASHIADAVSVINGYLGKKYTLPLVTVPDALRKVAADMARFFLHGDSAEKDSPVERAYLIALKWLRDVAAGVVVIEDAGVIPSPAGGGQVKTSPPNRVFTRDKLADF